MAVTTGSEDAWQRNVYISIDDGTTAVELAAIAETIDIDMGERELDKIDLLNLGQIPKHGPVGVTTVTFEGYPIYAGTAAAGAATGFWELFANKPATDNSGEMDVDMSTVLTRYRVAILWTDDSTVDQGSDTVASANKGLRFVMADCFCVSCKTDYTDKLLKQTLVFKGLAFNKSAAARIKMESCTASEALTALGTYTPGTTPWA